MSWASHNPELYSELVNKGIASKLARYSRRVDEEEAFLLIEELEHGNPLQATIHAVLADWAAKDISNVTWNHFAAQADAARERMEEQ